MQGIGIAKLKLHSEFVPAAHRLAPLLADFAASFFHGARILKCEKAW